MYFQDLTPYKYSPAYFYRNALNVGWLSIEHEFQRGDTPEEFRRVLRLLSGEPVNCCMGRHDCEYCETPVIGNGEIHVPDAYSDVVYIAPQLVAHYVEEHGYLPPIQFVEAVLAYKPPVIPWEAIRSDWKNQLPVLDGKWNQWRIFCGHYLLAVIAGDQPSAMLDLLQRHLVYQIKSGSWQTFEFEVARSCRSTSGEGVTIEQTRHAITCDFTETPTYKNTRHWLLSDPVNA